MKHSPTSQGRVSFQKILSKFFNVHFQTRIVVNFPKMKLFFSFGKSKVFIFPRKQEKSKIIIILYTECYKCTCFHYFYTHAGWALYLGCFQTTSEVSKQVYMVVLPFNQIVHVKSSKNIQVNHDCRNENQMCDQNVIILCSFWIKHHVRHVPRDQRSHLRCLDIFM